VALFDYEFRVTGAVPEDTLIEIEGIHVTAVIRSPPPGRAQTVMRGPVPDQAALHGIMNRLYSIGLDIIEVRRLDGERN
jgi:hypothetical protein